MGAGASGAPTWGAHLEHAERTLSAAGIPAPREAAIELLCFLLGLPRPALLAQLATPMRQPDGEHYATWVARRAQGEAVQQITGHVEFMGLDLLAGHDSPLVAPHARRLVELALETCRRQPSSELVAAELGTGCGAIALALAILEPRFTRIYALDILPTALEIARANGARYLMSLVINWLAGESLALVPEPVDVLVWGRTEPPAADHPPTVRNMPALAPHTAQVFQQARDRLRPGGVLVCAAPLAQQAALAEVLAVLFPTAQVGFEPVDAEIVIAVALLPRE